MIFTLFDWRDCERKFAAGLIPKQGIGSSVWKSKQDARAYLSDWAKEESDKTRLLSVFPVDADWDNDTQAFDKGGGKKHYLLRPAKIINPKDLSDAD